MYCPACGFEYTQKTNYCKRCGENLSVSPVVETSKTPRLNLAIMFCAVAAFGIIGLIVLFAMFDNMVIRGLRGDELLIPFMMGMVFTGGIAGLLIWQLARMISTHQRMNQNVVAERHFIREVPQAQLGTPTDQIPHPVEYPRSVVEHTTRQFVGTSRDPDVPK